MKLIRNLVEFDSQNANANHLSASLIIMQCIVHRMNILLSLNHRAWHELRHRAYIIEQSTEHIMKRIKKDIYFNI